MVESNLVLASIVKRDANDFHEDVEQVMLSVGRKKPHHLDPLLVGPVLVPGSSELNLPADGTVKHGYLFLELKVVSVELHFLC